MEFPRWVPQWVIEEFTQEFLSADFLNDPYRCTEQAEWMAKVVRSKHSAPVWETLDRFPDHEHRFAELSAAIFVSLWGFGHVQLKAAERFRIVEDVASAAQAISKTLSVLTEQDQYAINSIASDYASRYVDADLDFYIESFHRIWNEDQTHDFVPMASIMASRPAIRRIASTVVTDLIFSGIDDHLSHLVSALRDWAKRERSITKPDHPNARRLFFLREMTDFFAGTYGRPMRKETLALATVFFGESQLTEADLSGIAPVRNSGKWRQMTQPEQSPENPDK